MNIINYKLMMASASSTASNSRQYILLVILVLLVIVFWALNKYRREDNVSNDSKKKHSNHKESRDSMIFCKKCGYCFSNLEKCPQCGEIVESIESKNNISKKMELLCPYCYHTVILDENYPWNSAECQNCHNYFDIIYENDTEE